MYKFECICGEAVTAPAKTGRCPRCRRLFDLRWPVESASQLAHDKAAEPPLLARAAKMGT